MSRKPPPSSSSSSSSLPSSVKETHIEVCARVRPLVIDSSKNKSYFSSQSQKSPTGKYSRLQPPSVSPRGAGGARGGGSRSSRKAPLPGKVSSSEPKEINSEHINDVVAWDVVADDTVQQSHLTDRIQGRTISYTLDHVYGPSSTTRELYEASIQKLVLASLQGYHSSVFAYGQTSTGKTYTMTGVSSSPGIVPMAIDEIFQYIQRSEDAREYLIRVSYLEIYNEQIIDLLSNTTSSIRLLEGKEGVVVRGCREEVVASPRELHSFLRRGESRRQVGSTNMNKHSSRSHTIIRIYIESKSPDSGMTRVSSLSLVDLAGSESVRLTGASGERQREGQYINKSLMALGQVVYKLSEKSGSHIPYRDSKLTRILQPSLSGNAHIVIVCNISPSTSHIEESHNTLKFATRAKKVEQRVVMNQVAEESTLLQSYRDEIEDLRQQLAESKAQKANPDSDDMKEIVNAIHTMERLILKTKTFKKQRSDDPLLISLEAEELTEELTLMASDDSDDDMLVPSEAENDNLTNEMQRIQLLFTSMLQRRTPLGDSPTGSGGSRDEEVETLRARLHEQEKTTNLKIADSSFLQSQLREKDEMLEEIAKLVEAVEQRQIELESENSKLRKELSEKDQQIDQLHQELSAMKDANEMLLIY